MVQELTLTQIIFAVTLAFMLSHVSMLLLLGRRDELVTGLDALTEGFRGDDYQYMAGRGQELPIGGRPLVSYRPPAFPASSPSCAQSSATNFAACNNAGPYGASTMRGFTSDAMEPQARPAPAAAAAPRLPYRMFEEGAPKVPKPVAAECEGYGAPLDWAPKAPPPPKNSNPYKAAPTFIQNYNF